MPGLLPNVTGVKDLKKDDLVMIAIYPNPSVNEIAIQYYLYDPAKIELKITDMNGKTVFTETEKQTQTGLFKTEANISNLATGTYLVSISAGSKTYSKQIVKAK